VLPKADQSQHQLLPELGPCCSLHTSSLWLYNWLTKSFACKCQAEVTKTAGTRHSGSSHVARIWIASWAARLCSAPVDQFGCVVLLAATRNGVQLVATWL